MQPTFSSYELPSLDRDTSSGRSTFDQYLDGIGSFDLLTPEDEQRHARAVEAARVELWQTLLNPRYELLLGGCLEALDSDDLGAPIRPAVAALSRVLAGRTPTSAEETARHDAAARLARADVDTVLAQLLWVQLERLCQSASGVEGADLIAFRDSVARARECLHAARNRFACANLRLVVKVAQRYGRSRMTLADRVQEGNLGLMKAVDRFDASKGYRFSTYAAWWIRHAITRALINRGRTVRVPAHIHTLFVKMMRIERELARKLGREATPNELAAHLDVPVEKVLAARSAMQMRSVCFDHSPSGSDDDERSWDEVLEDPSTLDVAATMDERRASAIVLDAVRDLEPIEREVIERRFGLDGAEKMTLQKLGEQFSLSRERIRQLQNRALLKLRAHVDESRLPTSAFA